VETPLRTGRSLYAWSTAYTAKICPSAVSVSKAAEATIGASQYTATAYMGIWLSNRQRHRSMPEIKMGQWTARRFGTEEEWNGAAVQYR